MRRNSPPTILVVLDHRTVFSPDDCVVSGTDDNQKVPDLVNRVAEVEPHTRILPAFAASFFMYVVLHYHGAVELFFFLDDFLVMQPSNFEVVRSKA